MKTSMQIIIDDLKENNPHHYQDNKRWYDNLLEKEKQQIIGAYTAGEIRPYNSNKYYDSTFGDNHEAEI